MASRESDLPVSLREDERVLIRGVISNGVFWKSLAILIVAALFYTFIAYELGVFLSIIAGLNALYAFLLQRFLLVVVTNQRIFFRSGMLKVDTVQVRLDRVESVEIQRTIMGQFLQYGTVVLTGVGSRFSYIPFLANAAAVRDVIDELLYQREKK